MRSPATLTAKLVQKIGQSALTHTLKDHFPHTALFAAVLILVCFAVVALRKRDMFFRVVEVPFLLGVIVHGTYIVL